MTIIVLLILAGVSLNAIIGDNGILTQAIDAKEKYNMSSVLEELEIMMMDFNMSGETGSSALKAYMEKQIANEKITSYKTMKKGNIIQCIIEKDGYLFYAVPDGEYWKVVLAEEGIEVGGVQLEVYTKDNVVGDGTFELGDSEKETDVVFYEKIDGELNFDIVEGTVNIYIYNDMNLTNTGMDRSAINIHEGATLNLHLEDKAQMIVDSGFGKDGEVGNENGAKGGPGGYAGVHVPKTEKGVATFNIYGDGTLIAYGGKAGNGTNSSSSYGGGRRRWSSELELDGKGGKGGDANKTTSAWEGHSLEFENEPSKDGSDPNNNTNCAWDGEDGEDCGIISINEDIIIYAYGGSGGSGGNGVASSGGGARWISCCWNWRSVELVGGRWKSF